MADKDLVDLARLGKSNLSVGVQLRRGKSGVEVGRVVALPLGDAKARCERALPGISRLPLSLPNERLFVILRDAYDAKAYKRFLFAIQTAGRLTSAAGTAGNI